MHLPPSTTEGYWRSPWGRILGFWLPVCLLYLVGNLDAHTWTALANRAWCGLVPHLPAPAQLRLAAVPAGEFQDRLLQLVVLPTRHALYFLGLLLLVIPIARPVLAGLRARIDRPLVFAALGVFCLLSLLAFQPAVMSQGRQYLLMSLEPFNEGPNWYYRRVLIPALAHALQLRGLWYHVFAHGLTALLTLLLLAWMRQEGLKLRLWQALSILTCGWVFYLKQFPGYPDGGVYCLLMVLLLVPLSAYGRAACVALMLSAHDALPVFAALPLILFVFPRRDRLIALAVIALYFGLWLANFGFDVRAALAAQTAFDGSNTLGFLRTRPWAVPLGCYAAYKALWLVAGLALIDLARRGRLRDALAMAAILLFPLLQVVIAVDISRLVGAGFLAVLMALAHIRPRLSDRAFSIILAINLLLPSFYVATNAPVGYPRGLYQLYLPVIHRVLAP